MSKQTVKVTLEVPKGVVDFASDLLKFSAGTQSLEEFLVQELTASIRCIFDDLSQIWFDKTRMLKKYGLEEN